MKREPEFKYFFPKTRKKFHHFWYDLDERMRSFSDEQVAEYVQRARKIRIITQLFFLAYSVILKLNTLTFNDYILITGVFCFVFVVLFALLFSLERSYTYDTDGILKELPTLNEATLKQVKKEKLINFISYIAIYLMW